MSPGALEAAIAVWLFAVGAAAGSFLNVVIYRLPSGLSLNRPASHCPACKRPIRWRDNVPILGWIVLAGRCRDCRAPISPRYPVVEATTATIFLVIGLVEGLSGGANLPARPVQVEDGWIYPLLTSGQSAGIVVWHLLLLATLLAAVGIEYGAQRVPRRLYLPALIVGLSAPSCWPHLHPVPAMTGLSGPMAGPVDSLAGLAAGLAAGLLAGWAAPGRPANRPGAACACPKSALLAAAGCLGVYLGWQAVVFLAALAGVLRALSRMIGRWWPPARRIPATAWLGAASLAWIIAWRTIIGRWPIFG